MIALLNGTIALKSSPAVVVLIGGVGYEVQVTADMYDKLQIGDEITLYIAENIKEDHYLLLGFAKQLQRELYYQLTSVSGVGPKAAMAILSRHESDEIRNAIANGNTLVFSNVSGIGAKTASRIVLELKGLLKLAPEKASASDPAHQALVSLGYSAAQASEALAGVGSDLSLDAKVKAALKELAS